MALGAHEHHAGLAQQTRVVRQRRARQFGAEVDAVGLALLGEHAHHVQPQRLAEGEEHSRDRDLVSVWVVRGPRGDMEHPQSFENGRTMSVREFPHD
ncbi:hypothetical protein [Streptomyces anulatus]|uniref:hypothetical protein n=1 Tax=Streptomyces anulatus TaxID=1892 RepID=UPI00365B95E7